MKKKLLISFSFIFLCTSMMLLLRHIASNAAPLAPLVPLSDNDWHLMADSEELLYRGRIQYQLRCKKCHGLNLEGTYQGANLIDDVWLYGQRYSDIYESIYHGRGAMKGYGKKLVLDDIQAITVFIRSLSDKKKAP